MTALAFSLADRCPRLALAQLQRRREIECEYAERRHVRILLAALERLVAHRELQLARAQGSSSRGYMRNREAKLRQARKDLARLQARAERIGALGRRAA